MFDKIAKQLSLQSLGKSDTNFYITKEQFNEFEKTCVFYTLREESIGQAFCKKYNVSNGVLSILDGDTALNHIKLFYVK